jgi:outer membrane protein assembly factor BamE (lipoprotein component of BamABCDE complex)
MKNFMKLISIALIVSACATNDKTAKEKNPFDALTLKETLTEGKTSQAEIAQTFGAPDITTEDTSKNDVWIYSKHNSSSENNGFRTGALAFLPGMLSVVGGMVDSEKSETSSKTVTLTLSFDKNKKLKNYRLTKVRI